ncbi:MAG: amidohydrolase family protein [Syntrophaceae bacterium]|nr:amidohydrolase family protein [Syntrophaceae bacterium]
MNKNTFNLTRRELLRNAALSAALLSLPNLTGFTSIPQYQPTGAPAGKTLYLTNAEVIDVVRGLIFSNQTIAVRDGIIRSVSSWSPEAREGDMVLDLKNQYVLPGLIDAHCHITMPGASELSARLLLDVLTQLKRNFVQQMRQGVTTIRDMGAMPKILHANIGQTKKGELIGPRVVYCNSFTNIQGGHPDLDPGEISILAGLVMSFTGHSNMWFKDTEELKEKMRQNSAGGASFVKLTMDKISVLCGKGKIPAYSDEHLKTIFNFAQKNNLATAGHIHTKFGFDRALRFGLDSIEHSINELLSPEEIETMAKKNIATVPTVSVIQMMAAPEAYDELPKKYRTDFIEQEIAERRKYINSNLAEFTELSIHKANLAHLANYKKYGCENLYKNKKYMANPEFYFNIMLTGPKNLLAMKEAGIVIGCGTDAGVPLTYHGTLWREMEILTRIGFSNAEVLRSATFNNAKIIGMVDKIGTVDTGKIADMVILKENPLKKIEACRRPSVVIKDGKLYDVGKIAFGT